MKFYQLRNISNEEPEYASIRSLAFINKGYIPNHPSAYNIGTYQWWERGIGLGQISTLTDVKGSYAIKSNIAFRLQNECIVDHPTLWRFIVRIKSPARLFPEHFIPKENINLFHIVFSTGNSTYVSEQPIETIGNITFNSFLDVWLTNIILETKDIQPFTPDVVELISESKKLTVSDLLSGYVQSTIKTEAYDSIRNILSGNWDIV